MSKRNPAFSLENRPQRVGGTSPRRLNFYGHFRQAAHAKRTRKLGFQRPRLVLPTVPE